MPKYLVKCKSIQSVSLILYTLDSARLILTSSSLAGLLLLRRHQRQHSQAAKFGINPPVLLVRLAALLGFSLFLGNRTQAPNQQTNNPFQQPCLLNLYTRHTIKPINPNLKLKDISALSIFIVYSKYFRVKYKKFNELNECSICA